MLDVGSKNLMQKQEKKKKPERLLSLICLTDDFHDDQAIQLRNVRDGEELSFLFHLKSRRF